MPRLPCGGRSRDYGDVVLSCVADLGNTMPSAATGRLMKIKTRGGSSERSFVLLPGLKCQAVYLQLKRMQQRPHGAAWRSSVSLAAP